MKKKEIAFIRAALLVLGYLFLIQAPDIEAAPGNVSNVTAYGGNTTVLNMDLGQISNLWQGFFGTVSGGLRLANADNESFYDWTVVDAAGEILATRNVVNDWSLINCTNQTEIYQEEERLSILNDSSDGINDTYENTTHPVFDIAGRVLTGCRSTLTDNSTNSKVVFWNIILNTNSTNTVYTGIMDNDVIGFNGTSVDYQLLVPVDRLLGQSLYYIYVELD